MEMERNLIMQKQKQKLEIFDILKKALTISNKNINFIIFTFLTFLPLVCFLVYYEIILQRTLVETSEILRQPPGYFNYHWPAPDVAKRFGKDFAYILIDLGLLYLLPLHLLELWTMLLTVDLASNIHREERPMTFKEMVHKPIHKARLRGCFITSVYVLFLSTCTLLGLISLVTTYFVVLRYYLYDVLFDVLYGAAFIALLTKYLEWSAVWNMSIVISILEDIYGVQALTIANYLSRGNERRGRLLMLVFFVWGHGLRSPCLYFRCYERGSGILLQISLFCVGNLIKWVACMVYFYDCKKRILEKKIDEEVGREVKAVDGKLLSEECPSF